MTARTQKKTKLDHAVVQAAFLEAGYENVTLCFKKSANSKIFFELHDGTKGVLTARGSRLPHDTVERTNFIKQHVSTARRSRQPSFK